MAFAEEEDGEHPAVDVEVLTVVVEVVAAEDRAVAVEAVIVVAVAEVVDVAPQGDVEDVVADVADRRAAQKS